MLRNLLLASLAACAGAVPTPLVDGAAHEVGALHAQPSPSPAPGGSRYLTDLSDEAAAGFSALLDASAVEPARHASATATSKEGLGRVLVLVEDHGTGSTTFGTAIDTHPCMVDMDESFVVPDMSPIWIQPDPEFQLVGIFGADGALQMPSNASVAYRLEKAAKRKPDALGEMPYEVDGLYTDLPLDIAVYLVRVADHVCSHMDEEVCPRENCAVNFKWFPQYTGGTTGPDKLALGDHIPGPTAERREELARELWARSLQQLLNHPRVSVMRLTREPTDRELSVFRRFQAPTENTAAAFVASAQSWFNCELDRQQTPYDMIAEQLGLGAPIVIEECWESAEGGRACADRALGAVDLDSAYMTDEGLALLDPDSGHDNTEGKGEGTAEMTCHEGGALHFTGVDAMEHVGVDEIPFQSVADDGEEARAHAAWLQKWTHKRRWLNSAAAAHAEKAKSKDAEATRRRAA
jgi:hypothetical protein